MSTLAQTYLLASKVKQKLTKEAVNPNANLRIIVCQANLLDNLMESLQHKKPLPQFPKISISNVHILEEEIEDEFEEEEEEDSSLSSSDDEDDYEDEYEIRTYHENSPANVTTTEILVDDDSDDEDEFELMNSNWNNTTVPPMELESPHLTPMKSWITKTMTKITTNRNPLCTLTKNIISLKRLSSYSEESQLTEKQKNFKLVSIESDLPLLSHCSSISSEESVDEDNFNTRDHFNHGQLKTHTGNDYHLSHAAPIMI